LNILIAMGHPAHVHFFRHFIDEMESKNHEIHIAVKERENTTKLLDLFGLDYTYFGRTYPNRPSKAWGVLMNDIRLLAKARKFEPDLTASIGGLYSVHAGAFFGTPTIDFTDTEGAKLTNLLTFPFASIVATPDCYRGKVPSKKHRAYPGYHELAYLHPERFCPDPSSIDDTRLSIKDYIVIRLSSLDASHQEGESIMSMDQKIDFIKKLSELSDIVVDSEFDLPSSLQKYRNPLPENLYHQLLAHASLYVGEGATAASEAGVLGTPWIYLSKGRRSYLDDQEKRYQVGTTASTPHIALDIVKDFLNTPPDGELARKKMIEEKTDVTRWMVNLANEFL